MSLPLPSSRGTPTTPARQRDRIFDLSRNLHCSIVGTCLTTGDLRQLFAKLGQGDARMATAHSIHHRAVEAAGRADLSGKLMNKLLDKKHAAFIKRFGRAKTQDEVARLWREAMETGDIPGAYWATMTHPLTADALVREAFGDVHMLSHLVGTSNRIDITRLNRLESELTERDDKIARQEWRLRTLSLELRERSRRIEMLEAELIAVAARRESRPSVAGVGEDLAPRLAIAEERLARSAEELRKEREGALSAAERIRALEDRERQGETEREALQSLIAVLTAEADQEFADLGGARLLYVGGRPGQVEQLRALTNRFGGTLLSHDGGIEDSPALLAGLVSKAEAALFPVDCISHHAAGQVKKLCGDAGKPFVPLRSASVASYAAAIGGLRKRGTIGSTAVPV